MAVIAVGCGRTPDPVVRSWPTAPPDEWRLRYHNPTDHTPALLWNGLVGLRVGRDGCFADPRLDIGAYDGVGEEKIVPLQTPGSFTWEVAGRVLRPEHGRHYTQELHMALGQLETHWDDQGIEFSVVTVLHPDRRVVASRWKVVGKDTVKLTVNGMTQAKSGDDGQLPFRRALRGLADRAKPGSNASEWLIDPLHTRRFEFDDVVTMDHGPELSFDSVMSANSAAWGKRWETDIEIDGPVEDQQAIRSFMYYLRSSIHPTSGMSVAPFGLASATYNGHVFWDADIWVFPALALLDPLAAKPIADYRFRRFAKTGRTDGAPFPWESSLSGREVAPGAMHEELHVSGDAAWMLHQASLLGLADPARAKAVRAAVGAYYVRRSVQGPSGLHELKGVVSPDENHTGDNDLYTNLLAEWCINPPERNAQRLFKRPADTQSLLTYDGDAVRSYKQAAAVLAIYPLQMVDDAMARKMMDRFAGKVTPNGPAMSHSVHALIWARLGESRKAYDTWRKSWQAHTNHPFMLFAEKARKDDAYFTTGAAGCLQTVIYGFLGFRIDWKVDDMAAWSSALNGGYGLSISPHLPAAWKSVKFKNFTVNGKRYSLAVDAQGVRVTQGEP